MLVFPFYLKTNDEKSRYYPTPTTVCDSQHILRVLFSFSSIVCLRANLAVCKCDPKKLHTPKALAILHIESSQDRNLLYYHCLCVLSEKMLALQLVDNSRALLIAGGQELLLMETATICLILIWLDPQWLLISAFPVENNVWKFNVSPQFMLSYCQDLLVPAPPSMQIWTRILWLFMCTVPLDSTITGPREPFLLLCQLYLLMLFA